MNKTYIGIDFSLNSTALCINDNEDYKFINFINTKSLLTKKGDRPLAKFKIHDVIKDFVDLVYCPREKLPEDYAESQIRKLQDYDILTDEIISYISSNSIIGLEGYSYASNGQGYIDLITAQTILRHKILKLNNCKLIVIPPSKIKKFFTGKGNANKVSMLQNFKGIKDFKHPLFDYVLKTDLVKKEKDVLKPVDDIVDAYAIQKYLKEN